MEQSTRDVIVIGGGVSGLAAAYELEQHNVSYTLIEVKPHLGGSIITERRGGFVMDGGVFAFSPLVPWPTLDELGLSDALIDVTAYTHKVAFKDGSQTLVDALAARIKQTGIQRMAVTSVGEDEDTGEYRVCLENGLAMNTRGVVVAVPARYAQRFFHTLAPQVSETLEGYHYDDVTRLALGFSANARPQQAPQAPPDVGFATLSATDHPARVPEGGYLVQAAVRLPLDKTSPEALVQSMCEQMKWPAPAVVFAHHWTESDPLTVTGPAWGEHDLNAMLPKGVCLVGGCYEPLTLPQRTEAGREAARKIVESLKA